MALFPSHRVQGFLRDLSCYLSTSQYDSSYRDITSLFRFNFVESRQAICCSLRLGRSYTFLNRVLELKAVRSLNPVIVDLGPGNWCFYIALLRDETAWEALMRCFFCLAAQLPSSFLPVWNDDDAEELFVHPPPLATVSPGDFDIDFDVVWPTVVKFTLPVYLSTELSNFKVTTEIVVLGYRQYSYQSVMDDPELFDFRLNSSIYGGRPSVSPPYPLLKST